MLMSKVRVPLRPPHTTHSEATHCGFFLERSRLPSCVQPLDTHHARCMTTTAPTKKVFIKTFGCQMNEYDSDKMADVLGAAQGYEPTQNVDEADLILFNTCSVREKAQEKVFSDLGRIKHLKARGVKIGVGGCVASQEGAEIITVDFSPLEAPQAANEDDGFGIPETDERGPAETIAEELPAIEGFSPSTEAPAESITASPAGEVQEIPARPHQTVTISPVLYEIFSEEASGHLATLQRELAALERNELLPTPHAMYRAAHTLAGISATVGLDPINRLGLALEHALLRRDNSTQRASSEAIATVASAIGELSGMLETVTLKRVPDEAGEIVGSLEALYPVVAASVPAAPADSTEPEVEAEAGMGAGPDAGEPEAVTPSAPVDNLPQLPDEIDEQLLPIFLEEAIDLSQSIATQMRAWRNDPASAEPVRTLARLLHTLKGSARMAGAMRLGEITHAIETRVDEASRSGAVTLETIDEIHASLDAVQQIIERLQSGESLVQPSAATPELGAVPAPSVVSAAAAPAESSGATPMQAERRADRARITEVEAEADQAAQRSTLRVRSDLVGRLVNEAGELSIARSRIEGEMRSLKESLLDLTENVIRLRRQLREIEIQAESQMQSRTAQAADEHHAGFDPLEFDRFTRFQELTRMMAESVNDVATVQQNLLKNLDDANAAIIAQARLNREVQQELMSVRMVPFGSLADRLYRIVRQTSKELNKRVNLEIKGSQVELDRSVLDNVLLPLAIVGAPHKEALRRARAALDKVGLLEREKAHPIALSGGEQQRLAIARAVVNRPAILLADEPTANLDADSASDILAIFRAFHQVGVTLVVATHDPQWMARFSPRVLRLERGQLVSDSGDSA